MRARELSILPGLQDSGGGRGFERPAHPVGRELMLHFALQRRPSHPLQDEMAKAPVQGWYDFRAVAFTPCQAKAIRSRRIGPELPVYGYRAFGH
jgi:hypothetical protein